MSGWTTAETEAGAEPIRGQVTLTEEDVWRAIKEHSGFTWWHVVSFVAPAVLIAGWPAIKAGDDMGLIMILIVFVVVGAMLVRSRRIATRRVMEKKTEAERQLAFHFDESGYRITTPVSSACGQWNSVHRTLEGATTFIIHAGTNISQIVPKRALAEPDVPRLRALIAEHVRQRTTTGAGGMVRWLTVWAACMILLILLWQVVGLGNSRWRSFRWTENVEVTRCRSSGDAGGTRPWPTPCFSAGRHGPCGTPQRCLDAIILRTSDQDPCHARRRPGRVQRHSDRGRWLRGVGEHRRTGLRSRTQCE